MIYAVVIYQLRAKNIKVRGQGAFDDRYGPTALAILLFAAVVVNFVLRYIYLKKNGGLDGVGGQGQGMRAGHAELV